MTEFGWWVLYNSKVRRMGKGMEMEGDNRKRGCTAWREEDVLALHRRVKKRGIWREGSACSDYMDNIGSWT